MLNEPFLALAAVIEMGSIMFLQPEVFNPISALLKCEVCDKD